MGAVDRPRPISAEAQGRLRALYASLGADADRLETAVRRVPRELCQDVRRKFGRGADRALDQVVCRITAPVLARERRYVAWRYLKPAPGDRQGVAVMLVTLNAASLPGLHGRTFGLTVTHHALGRLLDRSCFRIDPVQAVVAAHDALLALSPDEGTQLFGLADFMLPTPSGAFLMSPPTTDYAGPMSIARTWVDADQLDERQERYARAWARVIEASAGSRP